MKASLLRLQMQAGGKESLEQDIVRTTLRPILVL